MNATRHPPDFPGLCHHAWAGWVELPGTSASEVTGPPRPPLAYRKTTNYSTTRRNYRKDMENRGFAFPSVGCRLRGLSRVGRHEVKVYAGGLRRLQETFPTLSPRLSRVDVPKVRGFGEVQAQGGFVLELGATGGGGESSCGGKA